MHKGLSPEIQEFIEQTEQSEGFNIKEVPQGTLIDVETRSGSVYTLVVSDPENHEVALVGPHDGLREPTLYYLQGATGGGSMVKTGWIGKGLRLRLNGPGTLLTTSPVVNFQFNSEPERGPQMLAEAESKRPEPATEDALDKFNRMLDGIIDTFPDEHQGRARGLVNEFNSQGRGIMVRIFELANEQGKLPAALDLIEKQYREHWAYRAPEIRGSFITEQDVHYIHAAYEELDLPLPEKQD